METKDKSSNLDTNYLKEISDIVPIIESPGERSLFSMCISSQKCLKILTTSSLSKSVIMKELSKIYQTYFSIYIKHALKQRLKGLFSKCTFINLNI